MATKHSPSPHLSASWRKPGQKLRQRVLDQDRAASETSSIQILEDCSIMRYYDVCDKVLEQFLTHNINDKAEMIESYVLGNRLVRLLSTLLPRHRDYYSQEAEAMEARAKSQEQLIKVLRYIDQLAILIDKEEHSTFIGSVIRNSSESSSTSSDDLTETHMEPSRIKIKVCESSALNSVDGDLGFSMILASESDRSVISAHNDSYHVEPKESIWSSNSHVVENKPKQEEMMPPNPLMRTGITITAENNSQENSLEEELLLFQNPSCSGGGSSQTEGVASDRASSKLERHLRVYPQVNTGSMKDPSVGYVSSTSSEHQDVHPTCSSSHRSLLNQYSRKPTNSDMEDASYASFDAFHGAHADQLSSRSFGIDGRVEDAVNGKAKSPIVAQESIASNESAAITPRDDKVTAAQIVLTDSVGFPTTSMNVSQLAFHAIDNAISISTNERSHSFVEFDSTFDKSNQSVFRTEVEFDESSGHRRTQSSWKSTNTGIHGEKDVVEDNSMTQQTSRSSQRTVTGRERGSLFDDIGKTTRIDGCGFVKTPVKSKTEPGPIAVSSSPPQSSRSRRIYSCSAAKAEDYEALSYSPNPSIESISVALDGKITPNSTREGQRHRLHNSFASAANITKVQSQIKPYLPANTEETSVSTPTSSTRSLSQSPNCNGSIVTQTIAKESECFFAEVFDSPSPGNLDPFSLATWSPNDYFSSHDHDDLRKTPSWTTWSDYEDPVYTDSDPSWFELEDHAAAKVIETPSVSFEMHQRSGSAVESPRSFTSSQIGFTKVSKSLSPICETSTTNSTSFAKSRETIYLFGSDSTATNKMLAHHDHRMFGQGNAVRVCGLDPRDLVPCRSRRRRNAGPVDLDSSIHEGFRCTPTLFR